eukprot:TRINITY_DN44218_c0_g1_i1.p3 TRINITY_DN44218_c0_g1~~TRINITY_DN44218_c0_g1_i1.p3  ORF type:complete len:122 (+),score=50.90 TRINITY_DN44218_c0_g1_i1:51-368(+)
MAEGWAEEVTAALERGERDDVVRICGAVNRAVQAVDAALAAGGYHWQMHALLDAGAAPPPAAAAPPPPPPQGPAVDLPPPPRQLVRSVMMPPRRPASLPPLVLDG